MLNPQRGESEVCVPCATDTLVNDILIAINPFSKLDIYGGAVMERYAGKALGDAGAAPHVYAVGEAAYRHLCTKRRATALIMSGESGAGKTETTKHLMAYIAWCSERASSGGVAAELAERILSSSPLLEAFGNCKTVRNNNSSRFGKMMRLHLSAKGDVAGGFVKSYLLEKSRVVAITSPERNYHIFYQLMAAATDAAKGAVLAGTRVSHAPTLDAAPACAPRPRWWWLCGGLPCVSRYLVTRPCWQACGHSSCRCSTSPRASRSTEQTTRLASVTPPTRWMRLA